MDIGHGHSWKDLFKVCTKPDASIKIGVIYTLISCDRVFDIGKSACQILLLFYSCTVLTGHVTHLRYEPLLPCIRCSQEPTN